MRKRHVNFQIQSRTKTVRESLLAIYLTVIGLSLDLIGVIIMAIPILTTDVAVFGTWRQFKMQKEDAIKAKKLTFGFNRFRIYSSNNFCVFINANTPRINFFG